jgi:flagellar basal body rod protein FlgG
MKAVAAMLEDEGVFQTTGTLTTKTDGFFEVRTADGTFCASRAVSCLVAPEEGDLVLLAGPRLKGLYVLAVLERPGCSHARISAEGNLTVELRAGRFTVAATEGVDLVSKKSVSVFADRLETKAREGTFLVGTVTLIAEAVNATLEHLSQKVKRIYRRVTELEHVRARQIDCSTEGNLRLHGENTLLTARELVKADAKQIHIG